VTVTLPKGTEAEGLLALRLPLSEERRHALERYVEQHPRSGKRLALASSLLDEGLAEEALPHLERGVERQPRQMAAWLDLIAIYRLQERPAAAACACEKALAANRGPAAPFLRGLHALCLGSKSAAEQAFLEACQAMPENPAPWIALAEIQLATGRPTEAAGSLEQALARNPFDVAALTLGSEALRLLGRSTEARRRDARALELDRGNPLVLERQLAASTRQAGGRLATGGGLWAAVERLARTRAEAQGLLSFVRVCGGDIAGAGEMAALVAQQPQLPQARMSTGLQFSPFSGR
jgi:tetratricopeptide (TPR) repeat protein